MSNIQQIDEQIYTLEQQKKDYIHYLCSYDAQVNVENATHITILFEEIKLELAQLYRKKQELKPTKNRLYTQPQKSSYQWSAAEGRAVQLFNADKRFTITE